MHAATWMMRALELAERGRGHVEPNPLVGAVLVKDGRIVGEGWHEKFGQAHAEVNALRQAGPDAKGATLYVTLEPCCHHGKTPPCTDAVIQAGVAEVVCAHEDPFPQVAGRGAQILQSAGIPIRFGEKAAESRRLNAPYLKLLTSGTPWVHAKWAMTLDGKIATRTGESKWISNEASRARVHALRGRMDAIVVGSGTALADDPMLTARPAGPRVATRVVLDRRGRLPMASHLVTTAGEIPTLLVTEAEGAPWRDRGVEVLPWPGDVVALLREFGKRRWTNILIEGGAGVLGAFFDARTVDEAHVFIAPKIFGGAMAPGPVAGLGIAAVINAAHLSDSIGAWSTLDGDGYWNGFITYPQ